MRSFMKMELEIGQGEGGSNFEYEQKEFYKTRKGKEWIARKGEEWIGGTPQNLDERGRENKVEN